MKQHQEFLDQVDGEDRRYLGGVYTTIPLWLDLGDLRVVTPVGMGNQSRSSAGSSVVRRLRSATWNISPQRPTRTIRSTGRSRRCSGARDQPRRPRSEGPNAKTRTVIRAVAAACAGGTAMPARCARHRRRWAATTPRNPANHATAAELDVVGDSQSYVYIDQVIILRALLAARLTQTCGTTGRTTPRASTSSRQGGALTAYQLVGKHGSSPSIM